MPRHVIKEIIEYRQQTDKQVYDIFLHELGGQRIAECKGPNTSTLEWWQVGTDLVVVQKWRDGGWEYYLQGRHAIIADIAPDIKKYLAK